MSRGEMPSNMALVRTRREAAFIFMRCCRGAPHNSTLERWITYATTGHDREDADALFLERGRTCHEENFVLSILAQN